MTESSPWVDINREYLMTALRGVQARLRSYLAEGQEVKEVPEAEDFAEALDRLLHQATRHPALLHLTQAFGLSPFERDILLLCAGVELDAGFAGLVGQIQGEEGSHAPTFSLALAALPGAHWSALLPEGPLRYWRLLKLGSSTRLTSRTLSIEESILHFLIGVRTLDEGLQDLLRPVPATGALVDSHHHTAGQLLKVLGQPSGSAGYPVVHLSGPDRHDKAAIARHAFSAVDTPLYRLPLHLLPQALPERAELVRRWNRQTALYPVALFLDAHDLDRADPGLRQQVRDLVDQLQGFVVLASDRQAWHLDRDTVEWEIGHPTRDEQRHAWGLHLPGRSDRALGPQSDLATQFDLDHHTIGRLAREAIRLHQANGAGPEGLEDKLWAACRRHTRTRLVDLAQRIEPMAGWDDLVLPLHQKDILRDIANHVRQRQKVYEEWGFAGKSQRGLGISALFAGESGTGKTMAAEVLARALHLDLFRIDLSQVVNKYIGETEKNLKKIFDAAEQSGAILLFDEADALFGKRSEVKDSHDRYANIEVSYLLQRMESYRGLAILTTNMRNALDKAFLRRLRFIVNFPFPDAGMRAEIWKRVIPGSTPTRGLDFSKLSRLHVAGGHIKNIMLNAAFLAADQDEPVTMRHLQRAARNEYEKLNKPMSPAENLL